MEKIVALKERDYAEKNVYPDAPADYEDALDNYDKVMEIVGEISGEVLAVNAESVENRPFDGKKYLVAGCELCGGRAFAMVERLFREIAILSGNDVDSMYPQINKLLEEKVSSSLVGDCRFCGTRNDPSVRGSVSNISEDNFTAADLAYSVLNGMSEELYNMYKNGGMKAKELVCSGNGIRKNAARRRIVSEMFGCDIKIPFYAEEASYGAALAASVANGCFGDISEACRMIKYKEN